MVTISLGEYLEERTILSAALGEPVKLVLGRAAQKRVQAARAEVESILEIGRPVYGVNTGFGLLAKERIAPEDTATLQRNLLLSHAVGTGPDLKPEEKRVAMILRLHSLCRGWSGVRPEVIRWMMRLFQSGWLPRVPEQGSVGACGDLAPLAHMALPILGFGEMISPDGKQMSTKRALKKIGLEPMELAAKEGLALINGVQISNAIGLCAWARAQSLSIAADAIAALSIEGLMASHAPFAARVMRVRPHVGAKVTGANLRALLAKSQVAKSHKDCGRIQDPYSFRCIPQVHGAAKDQLRFCGSALLMEANSATDNPIVFPGSGTVSAGNFHGQPIAMPMDAVVTALCAWGNISERRTATLINPDMNNMLPAFLTPSPGINSGLMIPQVAAAALVSENKVLAHPASADTVPTSADQEDHVSMANHAARKFRQAVVNTERVLAIELQAACQAKDFNHSLRAGVGAHAVWKLVRKHIPTLKEDRYLGPELEKLHDLVQSGAVARAAESAAGSLKA